MKKIKADSLFNDKRSLMLVYDHGLEHGPIDFDANNVDPNYVIYIATHGGYNGFIVQKGIAELYHEHYDKKVPLIIKLNGRSNIPRIFPVAKQLCSVKRAAELGADAAAWAVYVGSPLEPEIFLEFGKIQEEAHDYGLPVVAMMYPEGRYVTNEISTSMLAYAARAGLELGADIINIRYNDKKEDFKWVVRCAGKSRVVVSGGPKISDIIFLRRAEEIMQTGASGMAVGRNIWQHEMPMKMTAAVKRIIFENASAEDAMRVME